jgi:hypothetical protein
MKLPDYLVLALICPPEGVSLHTLPVGIAVKAALAKQMLSRFSDQKKAPSSTDYLVPSLVTGSS